jgi:hypothetical protein
LTDISIEVAGVTYTFAPDQAVTIGRSSDAKIVIDDKTISRIHAEVRFSQENSHWVFTDLKSANGSFINGQPVESQILTLPISIQIGSMDAPHTIKFAQAAIVPVLVEELTIPQAAPIVSAVTEEIAPPAAESLSQTTQSDSVNCGYCTGPINRDFGPRCPVCETFIHSECWTEFNGCITYGCAENPDMKTYQGGINV